MIWQDLHHSELDTATLYALLRLRNAVFIVEQRCLYQDIDGWDLRGDNRHILAWKGGQLAACARLIIDDDKGDNVAIGRIITAPIIRGQGLGTPLVEHALAACYRHWPARTVFISAQAHLKHFYERSGFVAQGDGYLEDGIPHLKMQHHPNTRNVDNAL